MMRRRSIPQHGTAGACFIVLVAMGLCPLACTKKSTNGSGAAIAATRKPEAAEYLATVYDSGFKDGWQDWGWSTRETVGPGPARVKFANWGGFILAKPGLKQTYGALVFRVKAPKGEAEYLEVRVESTTISTFPRVKIGAEHKSALPELGDEWVEVKVPFWQLNPDNLPWDRIILRAFREVPDEWTLIDKMGFVKEDGGAAARLSATAYNPASSKPARMTVSCGAKPVKISPAIYGIAMYGQNDEKDTHQWTLQATSRRWGGNNTTRYNWQIGAWNLDADWFFENMSTVPYTKFLDDNAAHGMTSALTVPMIGWVAKDDSSSSFPVSVFGPQGKTDSYRPEAGDGTTKGGAKISPGAPTRTSIPAPPELIKKWIETIRAKDAASGKRSVHQYILDNEPALWQSTHRDVHPEPLGYDELLDRTIQYGTAIRQADPDAVIAGPAEWGWLGYLYSGKDAAAGHSNKPDRRAHGDVPLIEWYLKKLAEHEQKTGVRVLDVVDLHYYPQGENLYGGGEGGTDAKTAALRFRATRSLWDPTYTDESWVKEKINLIPRMKDWIDKNYPGRGMSIGEWNFGGEGHISGALATAEALGRFGAGGLTSAFYWTYPPSGSPVIQAFLAYRNYDGKGARFLDWSLPASGAEGASLFVSRDEAGKRLVLIAINPSPDTALSAELDVSSCGAVANRRVFGYLRGQQAIAAGPTSGRADRSLPQVLPPSSITIIELELAMPLATQNGSAGSALGTVNATPDATRVK